MNRYRYWIPAPKGDMVTDKNGNEVWWWLIPHEDRKYWYVNAESIEEAEDKRRKEWGNTPHKYCGMNELDENGNIVKEYLFSFAIFYESGPVSTEVKAKTYEEAERKFKECRPITKETAWKPWGTYELDEYSKPMPCKFGKFNVIDV